MWSGLSSPTPVLEFRLDTNAAYSTHSSRPKRLVKAPVSDCRLRTGSFAITTGVLRSATHRTQERALSSNCQSCAARQQSWLRAGERRVKNNARVLIVDDDPALLQA